MTHTWTSLWRFGWDSESPVVQSCQDDECFVPDWNLPSPFLFSKRSISSVLWNCLSRLMFWVARMPTCVPSELYNHKHDSFLEVYSIPSKRIYAGHSSSWSSKQPPRSTQTVLASQEPQLFIIIFSCFRCKKKVPASKRFTVHRTSNVLTLSLKRFANFSGGKITKVSSYTCQWRTNRPLFCDQPADWWFSVRTLATQNSWTFAHSCPRARAIQWCMASMLSLCTQGTAAMLDTTTATSRWALLNKTHLFIYFRSFYFL